MLNKKIEYNKILARLFEQIMPQIEGISNNKPCASEYNRVRKMCRVYGLEIMSSALDKLEAALNYSKPPEFKTISSMLNYVNGISKKELLTSTTVCDKIDVGTLFKDM